MKQVKVVIFDIIFGILVCLLCISLSIKEIIVQTVNDSAIGHAAAIRIMDVIFEEFPDTPLDTMIDLQEAIGNSKTLDTITGKYIDVVSDAISNDQLPEYPDISNDLVTLAEETITTMEDYLGIEISTSQQNAILSQLLEKNQDIETSIQMYINSLINTSYFADVQSMLMKVYRFITSWIFKIILLIFLITIVYLIVSCKRPTDKALFHLGVPVFVDGILIAWIIPNIAQNIGLKLTNHLLGQAMFINTSMMQIIGMIALVLGVALMLASKIIYHKKTTSLK